MNTNSGGLRSRLEGFEIDEPGVTLPFSARLARENGWTLAFAARVVREYKRFLFLTAAAGHPVTPSEEVDQAWHLHMVYTRSYWDRLCGEILGRPLHHDPTQGGPAEGAKFRDWYSRTLESYAREFGEQPPADIWPPVAQRFAGAGAARWVDGSRFWLVPRPAWLPRLRRPLTALLAAGAVTGALLVPGCTPASLQWSPFEWTGGPFLMLYGSMYVVCTIWALRIRARRMAALENPGSSATEITDPYAMAYLAGGGQRVMQAALARLCSAGALERVKTGFFKSGWRSTEAAPEPEHPVEKAILDAARSSTSRKGANLQLLLGAAPVSLQRIENELAAAGLRPLHKERRGAQVAAVTPLLLLAGAGAIKAFIGGVVRGKPVGFLIAAMVITVITASIIASRRRFLTARGQATLDRARSQWQAAGTPRSAPEDLAYSVALMGPAMLTGIDGMDHLYKDLKNNNAASSGDSSGGGGCSSGCSSSGCGSSGCGGGGCGGCGGGD